MFQVPKEESIAEIRDRYMDINSHAASYNWKALKSSPGSDQVKLSCALYSEWMLLEAATCT